MTSQGTIKVYIDSLERPNTLQSKITYDQIKKIYLSDDANYEDIIFFSDDSNEFQYSNNEQVTVTPLYSLSLFQARKLIKKVSEFESQIEELENVKEQLQKFAEEDMSKILKISSLETQILDWQNKSLVQQKSEQLEITMNNEKRINDILTQKQQLDQKNYELQLKFDELQQQNLELTYDRNNFQRKFEQSNAELQQELQKLQKSQQLQYQSERDRNDEIIQKEVSLEDLRKENVQIKDENQFLQQRIQKWWEDYESVMQEKGKLQKQLVQYKNQYTSQIQLSMIDKNQNDQQLHQQNLNYMKQLSEKQTKIEQLEFNENQKIMELEKQIQSFQNKSSDPTKSQISINNQKDKKIKDQNAEIEQLKKEKVNAIKKYDDIYSEFQQLKIEKENAIKNCQQLKNKLEQAKNNYKDLEKEFEEHNSRIKIPSNKDIIQENKSLKDNLQIIQFQCQDLNNQLIKVKNELSIAQTNQQHQQMTLLAKNGQQTLSQQKYFN